MAQLQLERSVRGFKGHLTRATNDAERIIAWANTAAPGKTVLDACEKVLADLEEKLNSYMDTLEELREVAATTEALETEYEKKASDATKVVSNLRAELLENINRFTIALTPAATVPAAQQTARGQAQDNAQRGQARPEYSKPDKALEMRFISEIQRKAI